MVKIKCRICGDIGYSAAPQALVCKCGGTFRIVPENTQREEIKLKIQIFELSQRQE